MLLIAADVLSCFFDYKLLSLLVFDVSIFVTYNKAYYSGVTIICLAYTLTIFLREETSHRNIANRKSNILYYI